MSRLKFLVRGGAHDGGLIFDESGFPIGRAGPHTEQAGRAPEREHTMRFLGSDTPDPRDRRDVSNLERLAIAETEIRHLRAVVTEIAIGVEKVGKNVEKIEKTLAMASGVKLALITFGAGLSFIITQLWHLIDLRGIK